MKRPLPESEGFNLTLWLRSLILGSGLMKNGPKVTFPIVSLIFGGGSLKNMKRIL